MIKEIGKGVLVGAIIPILFVCFLYLLFYVFDKRINTEVLMSGILFGIGINALIVRKLFKEDKDYLGRGILIASFFYFLFWVIKFII
ncbi:hypothetical protein OAA49_01795 [Flavobacteriales bacterium]|nr:hypothetical protein [Flavobacteriales bacterium]